MTKEDLQYWLMCYPDQTTDAKESGLGPTHFYADETDGNVRYYLPLMPSAKKAAGLLKLVQGRRFVGTKTYQAENGRTYEIPEYAQFDSASCVRIDVERIVAEGLGEISDKPDSSGARSLYTSQPELPAGVVAEIVEVKLSDPGVPSFDSPRDLL